MQEVEKNVFKSIGTQEAEKPPSDTSITTQKVVKIRPKVSGHMKMSTKVWPNN